MLENGWTFEEAPGVVPDPQFGAQYLRQIYTLNYWLWFLHDPPPRGEEGAPGLFHP
jgi:hypothetical protein